MKMKYNTGRLEFMKFVSVIVFPSLACLVYLAGVSLPRKLLVITWIMHYPQSIPLTNRVRGPYRKLRTEFYGPSAKRAGHLNRMGKNKDP